MNLLKKRTSIFALIVIMISLTFMSAFAAETKEEETKEEEIKYGNWVEVADAMSEHLQKAVEVYKPGDKELYAINGLLTFEENCFGQK